MDFIIEIDTEVLLWINGMHTDYWDIVMRAFSKRNIWIYMYVAMAVSMLWRFGPRRALAAIVVCGVAVGLADFTCSSMIRPVVERLRPSHPDNPVSAVVQIVDGYRSGRFGFPSAHATNTIAVAAFTASVFRRWYYSLFIWAWALAQCYSRLYLGVHYPGDLLVGGAIGAVYGLAAFALLDRYVDFRFGRRGASPLPAVATGLATCVWLLLLPCL